MMMPTKLEMRPAALWKYDLFNWSFSNNKIICMREASVTLHGFVVSRSMYQNLSINFSSNSTKNGFWRNHHLHENTWHTLPTFWLFKRNNCNTFAQQPNSVDFSSTIPSLLKVNNYSFFPCQRREVSNYNTVGRDVFMNCTPLRMHVSRTDTKCSCHVGIIRTVYNMQEAEFLNLYLSLCKGNVNFLESPEIIPGISNSLGRGRKGINFRHHFSYL